MKTLVTGANGQLGQTLVLTAPEGGAVTAATRAELDITDEQAVETLVSKLRPDVIINAAAYTAVDKAESEPSLAAAVNETGARLLAEAANHHSARFIHVSTDFVFDGKSSSPYETDALTNPLGVYGATKLAGEKAALKASSGRCIVLRTSWVYSPLGRNFLLTMLRLMREEKPLRVVADQVGTPTSAGSIAKVIWELASKEPEGGLYHWTDAGVASWYDFAVAISEEAHSCGLLARPAVVTPIPAEAYPTPATRPAFSVLSSRATVDATGISQIHWRASLRRVLGEIGRV